LICSASAFMAGPPAGICLGFAAPPQEWLPDTAPS
jgi:hypothetical protein